MHEFDVFSPPEGGAPPRVEPIACIECRRLWLDPGERWRIYVLAEDPPEAVPYCQACATREFG